MNDYSFISIGDFRVSRVFKKRAFHENARRLGFLSKWEMQGIATVTSAFAGVNSGGSPEDPEKTGFPPPRE